MTGPDPTPTPGVARWCVGVTVCCPDQPSLVRAAEAATRMASGLAMDGLPVHVDVGPYTGDDDEPGGAP